MTYKENITAILECYFTGFKKEIIDSACNRILEVESCEGCDFFDGDPWIPVSERLPELGQYVLCSIADNYANHKIIISQYNCQYYWREGIVEAWMPLPEPYKAESEVNT